MGRHSYPAGSEAEEGTGTGGRRTLNEWAADIHKNNQEHGWWGPEGAEDRDPLALLMLVVTEVAEAAEEYRNGHDLRETYYLVTSGSRAKPEGFPSELADIIIRVLDIAANAGIDIEAAMLEKHEYNKTRPYRHGGKKA